MARCCHRVENQFIVEPREWWVTLKIVRADICRMIVASGSIPFGNNRGARYQLHKASDKRMVRIECFYICFIIVSKFGEPYRSSMAVVVKGYYAVRHTLTRLTERGTLIMTHFVSFCILSTSSEEPGAFCRAEPGCWVRL
jgi:hypothetical protein